MSGLLPLQQQLAAMGPKYSNAVSWISYQLNPRASIFRRDSSDVVDVESMKRLMRSNNYTQDKVSWLQAFQKPRMHGQPPLCGMRLSCALELLSSTCFAVLETFANACEHGSARE